MFVVIEGLSRTGKTTLAKEISRRMGITHHGKRPLEDSNIDDYVIGKGHGYADIDWRNTDLIMDRQLPSSVAYCALRSRANEKWETQTIEEFINLDKNTPCVYVYLKWNGHLSQIEQAIKADDSSFDMSMDQIQMFESDIETFIDASPNQCITVQSHYEESKHIERRRKSVESLADEVMVYLNELRITWDDYFMSMAHLVKRRSTGLTRHVGAVIARFNKVVGMGYNGAPSGVPHCTFNPRAGMESGENLHLDRTVHAEINAILNASSSIRGATIYTTTKPCAGCTKALINAGIKRIVYDAYYPDTVAVDLLSHTKIKVEKWE